MPAQRELFPSPPGSQPSSPSRSPISARLNDNLRDLNLRSTNHDRDQIATNIYPLQSTTTTTAVASQQSPAVPVPRTNNASIASNTVTNPYRSSRYPSNSPSLMNYPPNYYAPQYPQRFAARASSVASASPDSNSSIMRSPVLSPSTSSGGSSFASSSSSSSFSSSAALCERDLFPQATQFDMRIPMLPDPSPLVDPSFFLSSGHTRIDDGTVEELQHARRSRRTPPLSTVNKSRSPSPLEDQSHEDYPQYRPQHSRQNIEQVGILASAARPAGLTISTGGTATDTPVAVRVQFREDMLFGDGGCIDDDDGDEDTAVVDDRPAHVHSQSQICMPSTRDSEYDADEDDVSDALDRGRGQTPRAYGRREKLVRLDNSEASGAPRPLFPSMNFVDD
ncbi:hypothetical protein V1525DRAFT_386022 [Lipomyces kononenkoae]|uniref:Uncharacterized protein n=1 Tax=Lipomyces kononenkoae TaxID=34357 RepID=A0ACC3T7U5_LIPKO